jgi:hypothetical protein
MATLFLLMSVLAIVGDSLPVACVAPHRASPSLRLAESAMEMFGAADYSLDLELRVTVVDATTAGAGARCGAPPPCRGIDKSADDEVRMEHERRNAIEPSLS